MNSAPTFKHKYIISFKTRSPASAATSVTIYSDTPKYQISDVDVSCILAKSFGISMLSIYDVFIEEAK